MLGHRPDIDWQAVLTELMRSVYREGRKSGKSVKVNLHAVHCHRTRITTRKTTTINFVTLQVVNKRKLRRLKSLSRKVSQAWQPLHVPGGVTFPTLRLCMLISDSIVW